MSRGMHYLNVAKDGMADIPQSLYEPAKGMPFQNNCRRDT
jgi:hypothetical protein